MEHHAVFVDVVVAAKRKRKQYPPEQIDRAVTEARHSGAQVAVRNIDKNLPKDEHLSEDTVRSWHARWKKEGSFWQQQSKRGFPPLDSHPPISTPGNSPPTK